MKQIALFAFFMLVLGAFAIAAEDMKSGQIGVAVEMLVKDTFETTLEGTPELVEGYPDHKLQPEDGFAAKIYGYDGAEIYSFKFPVEFWFYDNPTVLTELPVLIIFPYYRNIKEAKIYDKNGSLRLTVDLSAYATCNQNGICNADIGEDAELCSADCRPGEAAPAGEETPAEGAAGEEAASGEEPAAKIISSTAWLIAVLVVILIAIVIGLLRSRKNY